MTSYENEEKTNTAAGHDFSEGREGFSQYQAKTEEIEVTPEMIEAGVKHFFSNTGDRFSESWPADLFVTALFGEMDKARKVR